MIFMGDEAISCITINRNKIAAPLSRLAMTIDLRRDQAT